MLQLHRLYRGLDLDLCLRETTQTLWDTDAYSMRPLHARNVRPCPWDLAQTRGAERLARDKSPRDPHVA